MAQLTAERAKLDKAIEALSGLRENPMVVAVALRVDSLQRLVQDCSGTEGEMGEVQGEEGKIGDSSARMPSILDGVGLLFSWITR